MRLLYIVLLVSISNTLFGQKATPLALIGAQCYSSRWYNVKMVFKDGVRYR